MSFFADRHCLYNYLIGIIVVYFIVCRTFSPVYAGPDANRTLVLDAGHGGRDTGARGDSGVLEKNVALTLARIIADEIGSRHRVVLTRTGDYRLDFADRAAVANHENADLFISLHAGGSFYPQTNGMTVFYHAESSAYRTGAAEEYEINGPDDFVLWHDVQGPYQPMSRRLARAIRFGIQNSSRDLEVDLREAPLLVLSSVDAPAVLLEVGYLTHSAEKKRLSDHYYLRNLAHGIIVGIDSFLNGDVPSEVIDLREKAEGDKEAKP